MKHKRAITTIIGLLSIAALAGMASAESQAETTRTAMDTETQHESEALRLPPELKSFVDENAWTFAKTSAQTWPHEYLVRDRVDEELFLALVRHIRAHGYEAKFYTMPITYFDEDGLIYWTMGSPIEETTIVNRCTTEQSYEYRLKHGTLPD